MDLTQFIWINPPQEFEVGSDVLSLTTAPHTDLWQKTYYHFVNDNAPMFLRESAGEYFSFIVKVDFAESQQRFDQAGIVVYLNSENWLKASVEYENQQFQHLGSVVTRNGFSDWATVQIPVETKEMYYRLSRRGQDFCIENSVDGLKFQQMRICHLEQASSKISFGVYACSPEESSFTAYFRDFQLGPCLWNPHDGQAPDK